jgi:hypothetical protein
MAEPFETLHVYWDEKGVIQVQVEGVPENAEEFGRYIADVIRAMLGDYHQSFETERSDGNVFADICDGLYKR